jgi:hypothetical protein
MSIVPKKKLCSGCNTLQILWKSNPPTCKNCEGKRLSSITKTLKRYPIESKPKPRVNGKPLHTAIYMAALGYGDSDFVPSEISGQRCIDIHHVLCRGMGSSKDSDRIENLMGLTREEHIEYGDKKQYMAFLFEKHMEFLERNGVKFNKGWILEQIDKYSDLE